MAYSTIDQNSADLILANSHNSHLVTTPSPRPADLTVAPLLIGSRGHETRETDFSSPLENEQSTVSKFLSSLTSSSHQSYYLVEDDDYEAADQQTPTLEKYSQTIMTSLAEQPQGARGSTPVRTASISQQLPMKHPTPDLQSIQGAYVKNVERLEDHAERLSMESSIEKELQRMRQEQRRRDRTTSQSSYAGSVRSHSRRNISTRSMGDSIVNVSSAGPSGGYLPAIHVGGGLDTASPRGTKGARSSYAPSSVLEGTPLDFGFSTSESRITPDLDPRPVRPSSPSNVSINERPATSGSGDTYQQANTLFTDFDGVHYSPDKQSRNMRRISITRPPRARDSRAFREPQPGEDMIYYPAPVPVMLNLPMRLSRLNWSEHEQRRLKALSGIPDDMRKSAAWLANEEGIPAPDKRSTVVLPPQLRASAFFDHRSANQEVQLKNGSAVATLDSILDAAAHAPVSAFTDHPIAGHLGDDFYGAEKKSPRKSMQPTIEKKAKRQSSFSNLLKRRSSGNLVEAMKRESRVPSMMLSKRDGQESEEEYADGDAELSMVPGSDEAPDHEDDHEHEEEHEHDGEDQELDAGLESESQFRPGFSAAPTTLLAELQMRKAEQKMRNRTAADAFPNGMHSTLLELDTVTQLQQRARRQKHVKLAWEDKDAVDKENFDDEDVPLGVLFPEKEQDKHVNLNRPLGLMEKRELEENEPLSFRRARLRGDPLPLPPPSPQISQRGDDAVKPTLDLPTLDIPDNDDHEGETLAQRKLRIKNLKENGTSSEFAQDLSSELGLKVDDHMPLATPSLSGSKTPDLDETLGQRRKRLQAEALERGSSNVDQEAPESRPALKTKRSLADVLRANPIGYVDRSQGNSVLLAMQTNERSREREARFWAAQELDRQQAYASRNKFGMGNHGGLIQAPLGSYQVYQQPYPAAGVPYMVGNSPVNIPQAGYAYPNITNYHVQPVQMNPAVSMTALSPGHPAQYPIQNYRHQPMMDLTGMGPPLDQKQRARIEGWRQGIM